MRIAGEVRSGMGRLLQRQLVKWDSLRFDAHAGTWEYNLEPFFTGARKIQLAGGSLRSELEAWHTHLLKCKGLQNLAEFVNGLILSKSGF